MGQLDTFSPFLPLPDGMVNVSISGEVSSVIAHIACSRKHACCPLLPTATIIISQQNGCMVLTEGLLLICLVLVAVLF